MTTLQFSCTVLLISAIFSGAARVQAASDFTTEGSSGGGLIITGYTGPDRAVVIPSTISGKTVTGIGYQALGYNVTSLTIPASVSSIDLNAFDFCDLSAITVSAQNSFYSSVAGVLFDKAKTTLIYYPGAKAGDSYNIPSSVKSIGEIAFPVNSLKIVNIPNSVTSIGDEAFDGCQDLTSFTVSAQNSAYSCVGGVLFNRKQNTLIRYPPSKAGNSYTIPSSVTSIVREAFIYCPNLASVIVPNSVTRIGDFAFSGCENLTSAIFLGSAPKMGIYVFDGGQDFTVGYSNGAKGFTSPYWNDRSDESYSAVNLGNAPFSQIITFPAVANQVYGAVFSTGATASSGLPVTYTSTGPVTISGNTVKVTGVGAVSIRAHQNGNSTFAAAPSVLRSFIVSPASQPQNVIAFATISNQVQGGTLTLSATASSGLTVSYAVIGPAKLANGKTLTFTGTGIVKITASQLGNGSYPTAKSITQTFSVVAASSALYLGELTNTQAQIGEYIQDSTFNYGLWQEVSRNSKGDIVNTTGLVATSVSDKVWAELLYNTSTGLPKQLNLSDGIQLLFTSFDAASHTAKVDVYVGGVINKKGVVLHLSGLLSAQGAQTESMRAKALTASTDASDSSASDPIVGIAPDLMMTVGAYVKDVNDGVAPLSAAIRSGLGFLKGVVIDKVLDLAREKASNPTQVVLVDAAKTLYSSNNCMESVILASELTSTSGGALAPFFIPAAFICAGAYNNAETLGDDIAKRDESELQALATTDDNEVVSDLKSYPSPISVEFQVNNVPDYIILLPPDYFTWLSSTASDIDKEFQLQAADKSLPDIATTDKSLLLMLLSNDLSMLKGYESDDRYPNFPDSIKQQLQAQIKALTAAQAQVNLLLSQ